MDNDIRAKFCYVAKLSRIHIACTIQPDDRTPALHIGAKLVLHDLNFHERLKALWIDFEK